MVSIKLLLGSLVIAVVAATASGCGEELPPLADGRLRLVATTGMIADAVANVAGDRAEVIPLMGAGVDPHLYKATHSDLERLIAADAVFYNGLHLEGKMVEVLEKLDRTHTVVAVSDGLDPGSLRSPPEFEGAYDPHIWFDVRMWMRAVERIATTLSELDSLHADDYNRRAADYLRRLDSLDRWVRAQIATIPPQRRLLVTAHDAFGYFGRAYRVEVRGLQGISTLSEYGLKDVSNLVDVIVAQRVPAVFIESSVPRRAIEAVIAGARARGHQLRIGGELYSDAMGSKGTVEGTYIGMVSANVNRIVEALR